MQKYEVENHAPSFLPEGKKWKLVWNDEFDGTELDTTKWDYRLSMMGKTCKHWCKDAITFDGNSNVIFKLLKKDGIYCTTQIQTGYNFLDGNPESYDTNLAENRQDDNEENYYTWPIGEIKEPKFMHKYGYYECRCKMRRIDGWWTAFWLQSPIIGSTLDPEYSGVEVDILEQFWGPLHVSHANHWNGYGSQHQGTGACPVDFEETEDGYHVFGLEWTEEYYRYYVDGKQTWEVKAPFPVSQREQFIILSAEAIGYRSSGWTEWEALAEAYETGDSWVVDYVRVYDEVK